MTESKRNRCTVDQFSTIVIMGLFMISLLPIFYVGLYTYPTGDDFWYGKLVMKAWREQHSVFACIGAAFTTIKNFYYSWQGTWYSIFLFCFNPEMFVKGGYKIVPVLAVGLLCGGYYLLLYQTMVKTLKLPKRTTLVCFCVLLFQMLQYMPRTTSGIYWFNGIMHYNANTFTAMVAISMMILFLREGKKYAFALMLLTMFLIGGGNYQAALMPLLFWGFLVIAAFFNVAKGTGLKERFMAVFRAKRVWLLGLGVMLEVPGVLISGLAPGNSIRSEEFEMNLKWLLQCVYYAIDRGIYLVRDNYFEKYPSMFFFAVLLCVFLWYEMWNVQKKTNFKFPAPIVFVLYMCGIYWAMYYPEIVSKSDVSGGVPDTTQQIFLITSLANIIYVIGYVQRVLREHIKEETLQKAWWGPAINRGTGIARKVSNLMVLIGLITSGLAGYSQSTDMLCVDLVRSGRAKVYATVRKEQIRILEDPEVKDARIPELFDYDYYPICHLQALPYAHCEPNCDMQVYYDKDSVVAYDFREWFAEAGLEYLLLEE